jgi:predicted lysophospholipase L1 biosynthesis ABC-type transport system permease subunit
MMKRFWAALYPMLRWLALVLLVYLFAQALPLDYMAVVVAGDMLAYLEVAAVVLLAVQVTRIRWAAAYTRFVVQRTIRRTRARARRAVRRIARLRPPSSDDDRPTAGFAFA